MSRSPRRENATNGASPAERAPVLSLVSIDAEALQRWIEQLVEELVEDRLSQTLCTLRYWAEEIHGRSYRRAQVLAQSGLIDGAVQENGPGSTWLVPVTAPWPGRTEQHRLRERYRRPTHEDEKNRRRRDAERRRELIDRGQLPGPADAEPEDSTT